MKKFQIKKVLVIYKEELKPHLSIPSKLNPSVLSRNSRLTEHEKTLLEVREVLKENKVDHQIVSRGGLKKVKGFDLLITVGGDGTCLDTSHYASPAQLLLGVNSHPKQSHGALCHAHRKNFKKIFTDLLKGKARLLSLNRLQVRIQGKRLPILGLNDVLFANRSPAGTSRYLLKVHGKKEEQKSSGIWVATAAGSTGALRSAGGSAIPKASRNLQFVVREPFIHSGPSYKILKGKISAGKTLRIISRMSKAAVFLDGAHLQYDLEFGEEVEIRGAKEPLWTVLN
jgi:NAD+ kinase